MKSRHLKSEQALPGLCHKLLLVPLMTMLGHGGTNKTGVATANFKLLNF